MPKKFNTDEERRAYWNEWYERNKHREDYKAFQSETKKRIRKERRQWFQDFKKTLKCERCGFDDYRALDFHHLDPSKKDLEVANMVQWRWSKKKIMTEVAKCKCLCANCHRITHSEERESE